MPKLQAESGIDKRLAPSDIPNPFREWTAENESRQSRFFVRGPHYEDLFVEDKPPFSCFVFAAPGGGKTTNRRMLERRYRPQQRSSTILAVNYLEFVTMRNVIGDLSRSAAGDAYWDILLQSVVTAFLRDLLKDPAPLFALMPERRNLYIAFCQEYLSFLHSSLDLADWLHNETYQELAEALEYEDPARAAAWHSQWNLLEALRAPAQARLPKAPMDRLTKLLATLNHCGLKWACVLVDGLDKYIEGQHTEAALNFLLPLCLALPSLEPLSIVFQFFLPVVLAGPMREAGVRFDRFPRFDLDWSDKMLLKLLQQRLEDVSDGKVKNLAQLATEQASPNKEPLSKRLDHELVVNAHGSPRQLLRLANSMFTAYTQRDEPDSLFTEDDLEWAIEAGLKNVKRGAIVPPLVIDEKQGRVSIGGRELNLTSKEFECLVFLREAQGELRSKERVWSKLYPKEIAYTDGQVDTFMSRLRKKLERDTQNPIYLHVERGVGYYLTNFV